MIEMCAGIKLSAKTDSPSSICLQCRLTMDEFFNFRKLCQRLNRVYRRKRNEAAVSKANAALEYHQGGAALVALAVPEVVVAEQVPVVHDIDLVAAEGRSVGKREEEILYYFNFIFINIQNSPSNCLKCVFLVCIYRYFRESVTNGRRHKGRNVCHDGCS